MNSSSTHDTRLRQDQVVEIGAGALRGEAHNSTPGAGPAFRAARRGGLAFTIAVVVDQDDQPLDPEDRRQGPSLPAETAAQAGCSGPPR